MANDNTIRFIPSGSVQGTLAPLALGTSTTETAFSFTVPLITSLGGGPAVVRAVDQASAPQFYDLGRPFIFRAYGTVTTGTTATLILKLYQVPSAIVAAGTALTLSNDVLVHTYTTSGNIVSATRDWVIEARLQWDSVSQVLSGTAKGIVAGTITTEAAISGSPTGLVSDKELNFLVSATLSAGNAANVLNPSEMAIEQV